MNGFWKLTNFLFGQMMKKKGAIVLLASLAFGMAGVLAHAFPRAVSEKDMTHLATAFLPYEGVVDQSGVMFVFLLGLVLLFIIIYATMNKYFTNGKGIYTLLMLPLKRREIYFAFAAAALGMLFLYFAAWLVLMTILYFPVTANYTRVAAQEVFRTADGAVIQALDATRNNGLYLAFRRSVFLSACFPSSLWQFLPFATGLLLVLASILYGGLRVGDKGGQVAVMIFGTIVGVYAMAIPALYINETYNAYGTLLGFLTLFISRTGVGAGITMSAVAIFGLVLVVRFTLKNMDQKNA